MTCLPRKSERREETFEEGGDCFFADWKPFGGLYGCGPGTLTLQIIISFIILQDIRG